MKLLADEMHPAALVGALRADGVELVVAIRAVAQQELDDRIVYLQRTDQT